MGDAVVGELREQAGLAGFTAGSRVAGYRLEKQAGAGGMAVVFRAWDERLHRLVALKILAPGLAADETFRRRFIRESRAAAAVDDPHIIPVHEAGEADGVLFIAMRYVAGGDVRTLLRQNGPLSPERTAAIVSPVASALDAAHGAGLVHRDVKPANILIDDRPGRPDHVYLSDFGLSKGTFSESGPTISGQFLGTPGYSSPEQIAGKPVDGRADQYSLACAAFELLSGELPFPRDHPTAVIWAHMSEQPPQVTSRQPGLPPAADVVLAQALAKTPADRYPSCREFAEALRCALGLAPYHSSRETRTGQDRLAARHHGQAASAIQQERRISGQVPQRAARHALAGKAGRSPTGTDGQAASAHTDESLGGFTHPSRVPPAGPLAPPLVPADPGRRPGSPSYTRRALLALSVASAGGLALAGWDLTHQQATPRKASRTAHAGTLIWNVPTKGAPPPYVEAVTRGIVYVSTVGVPALLALRASDGAKLWASNSLNYGCTAGNAVCAFGSEGLYSLDASDGHKIWRFPVPDPSAPVTSGNVIYTVDKYGEVHAVSALNGREIWNFPTEQGESNGLAVAGDVVYVGGANAGASLYALRSGRVIWRSPLEVISGPMVTGSNVYVASGINTTRMYALRKSNGTSAWTFRNGPNWMPVVADGIAFINGQHNGLYALRTSDGSEAWRFGTDYDGWTAVAAGDSVCLTNNADLYLLRARDGKELWHLTTGGGNALVTVSGDMVYLSSNNFQALRAADGKKLWDFPVEASAVTAFSNPVSQTAGGVEMSDGRIFFGSSDGQVYALRAR